MIETAIVERIDQHPLCTVLNFDGISLAVSKDAKVQVGDQITIERSGPDIVSVMLADGTYDDRSLLSKSVDK